MVFVNTVSPLMQNLANSQAMNNHGGMFTMQ